MCAVLKPAIRRVMSVLWSFCHVDGEQVVALTVKEGCTATDYTVRVITDDMSLTARWEKAGGPTYTVECDHLGRPFSCSCPARVRNCKHVAGLAKLLERGVVSTYLATADESETVRDLDADAQERDAHFATNH